MPPDRGTPDGSERKVKVGRQVSHVLKACEECRRRKMRCDGTRPVCASCKEKEARCVYNDEDKRKTNADVIQSLCARVDTLENLVKTLMQASHLSGIVPDTGPSQSIIPGDVLNASNSKLRLSVEPPSLPIVPDPVNLSPVDQLRRVSARSPEARNDFTSERKWPPQTSLFHSGATSLWAYSSSKAREDPIPQAEISPSLPKAFVNWSRNLPSTLQLSRDIHDEALAYFSAYYAPWCLVVDMPMFLNDLQLCNSPPLGSNSPDRTAHYSALLHCCALYLGLYMIRDRYPTLIETYNDVMVEHCGRLVFEESEKPGLGSLKGLNLFAICMHYLRSSRSGVYRVAVGPPPLTGFLYAGMALSCAHALCHGAQRTNQDVDGPVDRTETHRAYAYWSINIVDILRAIPHGRPPLLSAFDEDTAPYIDEDMDRIPWTPIEPGNIAYLRTWPSMRASTLHWLAKLGIIIRKMLQNLYSPYDVLPQNASLAHRISAELQQWYHELPLKPVEAMPLPHILMLHLTYNLVMILVHRPFHRSADDRHRIKCQQAAASALELLQVFDQHHGLRKGHHNMINGIFASATVFLLQSLDTATGVEACNHQLKLFDKCVEYMSALGQTWPEAIKAKEVLQSLKSEYHHQEDPSLAWNMGSPFAQDNNLETLHEWLARPEFWGELFQDQQWDSFASIGADMQQP